MRGPNYWSVNRHNFIVMLLDIEELEEKPTNLIPGFYERLKEKMPTLYEHRCSEEVEGGFFQRVIEGTWMGHVIEHIALELQTLADMDVGFGRTRGSDKKGVYHVVFSYVEEEAGIYTAKAAVAIAQAIIDNVSYDIEKDIQNLREIRENTRLGPSTGAIVEEAVRRKIPWIRLNKHSLVQLGYGVNQKRIQATMASTTSSIAVELACDKEETKNLLDAASVPVPRGYIVRDEEALLQKIDKLGFPIVLKPLNGNHGRGATINITNKEDAILGLHLAQEHSKSVICERYVNGRDFRALVINYKFVAAALRTPAAVMGDGEHSIQELIEVTNQDPRRGYGHEKILTHISINQQTLTTIEASGYNLESVLPKGKELWVKPTANLSTGGTSEDVTDLVHPTNIILFERIARIIGLDICGIDVISQNLRIPLSESKGAVIEVNAAPGFRMHLAPVEGLPRNVADPVLEMLYPDNHESRIPIIAITGTNGKTTTTRLIAHIMRQSGKCVGFTTTEGIYVRNQLMQAGDCTGPKSAEFILKDPTVEIAVLECARGGILRSGLGFHNCNVAVVTNVAADHLGLGGIDTIEKLAHVKSVVPKTVFPNGYAILNADDDLVFAMRNELDCKIALFSLDEKSARVKKHCAKGGLAAIYENGYLTILKAGWKIRVEKVTNVPITFSGTAEFNVANALGAILAAYVSNQSIESIRLALQTFVPSPALTPGRMNVFKFNEFTVMLDYAHNTHGMKAISKFLNQINASWKVGIIAGVGDRRDEDTMDLGEEAGKAFDEIIIRQDKNLRGRTDLEIIELIKAGIYRVRPEMIIHVIPKQEEAIEFALKNAKKDSFITIISDVVPEALEQVKALKEAEGSVF